MWQDALNRAELIGIAGHAATWLSVFIVFFTLREMQRQHRASYTPDLFVRETTYLKCISTKYFQIPLLWIDVPQSLEPLDDAQIAGADHKEVLIPLSNVGLGTAKHVSVRWNFNWKELLEKVQQLPLCKDGHVQFQEESMPGVYTILFGGEKHLLTNVRNDSDRTLDYVLPIDESRSTQMLRIPVFLRYLFSILILEHLKQRDVSIFPLKCSANLLYEDIGGRSSSKTFYFNLELVAVHKDGLTSVGKELLTLKLSTVRPSA